MKRKLTIWALGLVGYVLVAWLGITLLWGYFDFYSVSVVIGTSIFIVMVWLWVKYVIVARLKKGEKTYGE